MLIRSLPVVLLAENERELDEIYAYLPTCKYGIRHADLPDGSRQNGVARVLQWLQKEYRCIREVSKQRPSQQGFITMEDVWFTRDMFV